MTRKLLPAVAILAVVGGLIAVCIAGQQPASNRPDVPAISLARADGGQFHTAALRGRSPLIVNFFTTSCPACRVELPELIKLYKKHRAQGLQVVGITIDDAATVRRFAKEQQVPYPLLIDSDQSVWERFQIAAIPVTLLLDKQGRAVGMMSEGYSDAQFEQIAALTERVLKE